MSHRREVQNYRREVRSTRERVNLSEYTLKDQEEEKEISQHGSAEKGGQDQSRRHRKRTAADSDKSDVIR